MAEQLVYVVSYNEEVRWDGKYYENWIVDKVFSTNEMAYDYVNKSAKKYKIPTSNYHVEEFDILENHNVRVKT